MLNCVNNSSTKTVQNPITQLFKIINIRLTDWAVS